MSLILAAVLLPEAGSLELFRRGEDAFRAGLARREKNDRNDRGEADFREAARAWEAVRARGVDTAPLYRNLGHAYFLAGELPRAILCYRLGLRREPGDAELRAGLLQARSQVVFAEGTALGRPVETHSSQWLEGLSLGWLFALGVVLHTAGWACLTRWYMVRGRKKLIAGIVLLVAGLSLGWVVFQRQDGGTEPPVVVIARDGVLLRKGNGSAFPPWSDVPLNRGVEAEEILARDGWVQIRLAGGEIGWVEAAEVVVGDDPEASR
jgi:hypothetical protein